MIYPTARSVLLMAAGVPVALVVGVLWPTFWMAGFAWMLFVLLMQGLDVLLAPASGRIRADLALPRSLVVGGTGDAVLRVATPVPVETVIDIDPRLGRTGPVRRTVTSGEDRQPLVGLRRGRAAVSNLWLRWRGPLGLVWRQRREALDETVPIIPDLRPVRDQAELLLRQALAGDTARRETGSGAEFQSLLPWADGMDRRAIDWKQSARHATLLARDWRIERNNQIMLVVDAGRAMSEPLAGVSRIDRAVSAALLAAHVALKLEDRVGLYAYAEAPIAMSAITSGIASFPALQRLAAGIDYGTRETNHTLGLTRLAQRLDRRTLIILFTELTDPTSAELMLRATAPLLKRHLLLFLVHRDEELEALVEAEPETPEDVTRAIAAAALLRERAVVAARLRRMGAHVVEARHDAAGTALVDAYVGLKRQGLL